MASISLSRRRGIATHRGGGGNKHHHLPISRHKIVWTVVASCTVGLGIIAASFLLRLDDTAMPFVASWRQLQEETTTIEGGGSGVTEDEKSEEIERAAVRSGNADGHKGGQPMPSTTSGGGGGGRGYTEEETRDALTYASSICNRHGYVMIQMFNYGYVEMTKSWICNVRRLDDDGRKILDRTLFVVTDREAYDAIISFDGDLHVVFMPYETSKVLKYGAADYYAYMLFRTNFLVDLLANNVTAWLIESDAVWLHDPTQAVIETEGDIVTMRDDATVKSDMGNGGFQLLRPTPATKSIWNMLRTEQIGAIERLRNGTSRNSILLGNEQHMMKHLRKRMMKKGRGGGGGGGFDLTTGWLPVDKFVSGIWYLRGQVRTSVAKSPTVILNNYISGNDAKIRRAKRWGHWFLDENGMSCLRRSVNDEAKGGAVAR